MRFKKPARKRRVQVCPVCGSIKVRVLNPATVGFVPPVYLCEACGYKGSLLAEVDLEEWAVSESGEEAE